MALNKSKGNMYPFVTHTWNIIKGKCPHDCEYCFMKRFGEQRPVRFDLSELKTDLGEGNFIFVGSSCDMWADSIPKEWILDTVAHCRKYKNKYLFQSKNPQRMRDFEDYIPIDSILGTTIETNRAYTQRGNSPLVEDRAEHINALSHEFKTMVTIEPIMDFDPKVLPGLIWYCNPEWVNIGADSKNCHLSEPSSDKTLKLVEELKGFTEVKIKSNLQRLLRNNI